MVAHACNSSSLGDRAVIVPLYSSLGDRARPYLKTKPFSCFLSCHLQWNNHRNADFHKKFYREDHHS